MAISVPLASKEQVRRLKDEHGQVDGLAIGAGELGEVEETLSKIESMKTKNLITPEEAEKLRAKALGID